MTPNLMDLSRLGAVPVNANTMRFGLCLPWVRIADGNRIKVKIIHEDDQFLKDVAPREFDLAQADLPPYGEHWSTEAPIVATVPADGSRWGQPGRYVYRYEITSPTGKVIDWVTDPFAREFGVGKLAAFWFGAGDDAHVWGADEAAWRTPALADLVLYEIHIHEFAGDMARAKRLMRYLRDLGVNAIEVMPLSNVGVSIDWGYLPIGYFGVDERFGRPRDLQQLVQIAHANGIAVIADVVYGHAGVDFAYWHVYQELGYHDNPFMGDFAKNLFEDFGKSTNFNRQLTLDYFYTASHHWLDVYHLDGFRYDCVPNYWYPGISPGYTQLVYAMHELVLSKARPPAPPAAPAVNYWERFSPAPDAPLTLIQCAEQLEHPQEILHTTYSNCTWQNFTYDAAKSAAHGSREALTGLGATLCSAPFPKQVQINGHTFPRAALHYIENHDHERFICHFGTHNPDPSDNWLYRRGKRENWQRVRPYLIALLLADGIPMLWQGQELCEDYFLPEGGAGRVGMLRPVRWDLFYDEAGRETIRLVRRLLDIRSAHNHLRRGKSYFFDHWDRYQSRGVMVYARHDDGQQYTLVAVNTDSVDHQVPFWFDRGGNYIEELHGGSVAHAMTQGAQTMITVPANYGCVWTRQP